MKNATRSSGYPTSVDILFFPSPGCFNEEKTEEEEEVENDKIKKKRRH